MPREAKNSKRGVKAISATRKSYPVPRKQLSATRASKATKPKTSITAPKMPRLSSLSPTSIPFKKAVSAPQKCKTSIQQSRVTPLKRAVLAPQMTKALAAPPKPKPSVRTCCGTTPKTTPQVPPKLKASVRANKTILSVNKTVKPQRSSPMRPPTAIPCIKRPVKYNAARPVTGMQTARKSSTVPNPRKQLTLTSSQGKASVVQAAQTKIKPTTKPVKVGKSMQKAEVTNLSEVNMKEVETTKSSMCGIESMEANQMGTAVSVTDSPRTISTDSRTSKVTSLKMKLNKPRSLDDMSSELGKSTSDSWASSLNQSAANSLVRDKNDQRPESAVTNVLENIDKLEMTDSLLRGMESVAAKQAGTEPTEVPAADSQTTNSSDSKIFEIRSSLHQPRSSVLEDTLSEFSNSIFDSRASPLNESSAKSLDRDRNKEKPRSAVTDPLIVNTKEVEVTDSLLRAIESVAENQRGTEVSAADSPKPISSDLKLSGTKSLRAKLNEPRSSELRDTSSKMGVSSSNSWASTLNQSTTKSLNRDESQEKQPKWAPNCFEISQNGQSVSDGSSRSSGTNVSGVISPVRTQYVSSFLGQEALDRICQSMTNRSKKNRPLPMSLLTDAKLPDELAENLSAKDEANCYKSQCNAESDSEGATNLSGHISQSVASPISTNSLDAKESPERVAVSDSSTSDRSLPMKNAGNLSAATDAVELGENLSAKSEPYRYKRRWNAESDWDDSSTNRSGTLTPMTVRFKGESLDTKSPYQITQSRTEVLEKDNSVSDTSKSDRSLTMRNEITGSLSDAPDADELGENLSAKSEPYCYKRRWNAESDWDDSSTNRSGTLTPMTVRCKGESLDTKSPYQITQSRTQASKEDNSVSVSPTKTRSSNKGYLQTTSSVASDRPDVTLGEVISPLTAEALPKDSSSPAMSSVATKYLISTSDAQSPVSTLGKSTSSEKKVSKVNSVEKKQATKRPSDIKPSMVDTAFRKLLKLKPKKKSASSPKLSEVEQSKIKIRGEKFAKGKLRETRTSKRKPSDMKIPTSESSAKKKTKSVTPSAIGPTQDKSSRKQPSKLEVALRRLVHVNPMKTVNSNPSAETDKKKSSKTKSKKRDESTSHKKNSPPNNRGQEETSVAINSAEGKLRNNKEFSAVKDKGKSKHNGILSRCKRRNKVHPMDGSS